MSKPTKEYIGDGVYAAVAPGFITLTTEDGVSVMNTIYLEAELVERFFAFAKRHGFIGGKDF